MENVNMTPSQLYKLTKPNMSFKDFLTHYNNKKNTMNNMFSNTIGRDTKMSVMEGQTLGDNIGGVLGLNNEDVNLDPSIKLPTVKADDVKPPVKMPFYKKYWANKWLRNTSIIVVTAAIIGGIYWYKNSKSA